MGDQLINALDNLGDQSPSVSSHPTVTVVPSDSAIFSGQVASLHVGSFSSTQCFCDNSSMVMASWVIDLIYGLLPVLQIARILFSTNQEQLAVLVVEPATSESYLSLHLQKVASSKPQAATGGGACMGAMYTFSFWARVLRGWSIHLCWRWEPTLTDTQSINEDIQGGLPLPTGDKLQKLCVHKFKHTFAHICTYRRYFRTGTFLSVSSCVQHFFT